MGILANKPKVPSLREKFRERSNAELKQVIVKIKEDTKLAGKVAKKTKRA